MDKVRTAKWKLRGYRYLQCMSLERLLKLCVCLLNIAGTVSWSWDYAFARTDRPSQHLAEALDCRPAEARASSARFQDQTRNLYILTGSMTI